MLRASKYKTKAFLAKFNGVALLVVIILSGSAKISAQEPSPTPVAASANQVVDLERRVNKLEVAQGQTIESLKSNYDHSKFLIQMIGGLIAILVTIQGFTTFFQVRRERQRYDYQKEREQDRDSRQAKREDQRDVADQAGIDQVSKIMNVVERTLESRLSAEKEARDEAKKAHGELQNVLDEIKDLKLFYENFQSTILKARKDLSETASKWAKEISRHDFRRMVKDLNDFAHQFDKFNNEFKSLDRSGEQFGARVPYIRGIAAHYANRPQVAKDYLTEVVSFQQPESGENELHYNRRNANAYYYLGLIEANFGNDQDAIAFFEKANQLDTKGTDFLTKVAMAESYTMINSYGEANQLISEIEKDLLKIEHTEGRLAHYHQRLKSRAALIKANIIMLEREDNWSSKALKILEEVHTEDPQYYYAIATLAQVYDFQQDENNKKELFSEAYETIQQSGDLLTVTEARSRILLLMCNPPPKPGH